ncbi:MAG: VCBS repeat-containing protein [Bacteroidota bacterium]
MQATKVYFIKGIIYVLFCALIIHFVSFNNIQRNQSHKEISNQSIIKGKQLAAIYCKTCHMLPEPSLLDADTWEEKVLPAMGPHLGIFEFDFRKYPSSRGDIHLNRSYYPSQPVITNEQWQDLVNYYIAISPDSLTIRTPKEKGVIHELPFFQVQVPSLKYTGPTIGYVKINTRDSLHRLIASDLLNHTVFFFDKDLRLTDSLDSKGPVVNIDFQPGKIVLCNIGSLVPTNGKFGKAQFLGIAGHQQPVIDSSVLFDKLARPVQVTSTDLNQDGITDYLACEFGYLTGSLSWMEGTHAGSFIKHILNPLPGAIEVHITDFNHDGLPDILALMAHAEEGIFLYENKGNGLFDQQEILRFPPSYGSSSFELDDFNKDGFADILYTCGDNADYSPILKPYHGVYIFMNDGRNHFEQKYFFPLNGCYKAIAGDFDRDGDLDIAAISFFADYRKEEGFIYLQNNGPLNFKPYTTALLTTGRWLSMDAGDIDGDGRPDLVLGNCSRGPISNNTKTDWTQGPPFIVLKNISP